MTLSFYFKHIWKKLHFTETQHCRNTSGKIKVVDAMVAKRKKIVTRPKSKWYFKLPSAEFDQYDLFIIFLRLYT